MSECKHSARSTCIDCGNCYECLEEEIAQLKKDLAEVKEVSYYYYQQHCNDVIRREKEQMGTNTNITGRLESWYTGMEIGDEFIIWGDIYDDVNNRFGNGLHIHTSGIKKRDVKEGDIVETRNSRYVLGKKYESL